MKNIAIIGAGFSGLAVAWHLQQNNRLSNAKIVIYDSLGIGGGTSGIAAGLLHPFVGSHSKLNWKGLEAWEATRKLLDVSSKALNKKVADYSGILRPALTDYQQHYFQECSKTHPIVQWLDAEECSELVPGIITPGGILIRNGITVYCDLYLEGLWKACEANGAEFVAQSIESLNELSQFDAIVVTTGANVKNFSELAHLPITQVKGQILELEWPEGLPPLQLPLNSQAYIVMDSSKRSCLVGSTYEKNFISKEPDIVFAAAEILPKLYAFYPALENAKILGCRSGIRASAPKHLPLLTQFQKNGWVLTGMGSKGLLYHALFAEQLAQQIN